MVTLTEAIKPYKHSDIEIIIKKKGKYLDYDVEIGYGFTDIDGIRFEVVNVNLRKYRTTLRFEINPRDFDYYIKVGSQQNLVGYENDEWGTFTLSFSMLDYIVHLAKIAQQELKVMITAYDNMNIMYENLLTTDKC